jgi:hypothetical protein
MPITLDVEKFYFVPLLVSGEASFWSRLGQNSAVKN